MTNPFAMTVLAVGASGPSARPAGGWGTALVVMGTLALSFAIFSLLLERIAVRTELARWLRELSRQERGVRSLEPGGERQHESRDGHAPEGPGGPG